MMLAALAQTQTHTSLWKASSDKWKCKDVTCYILSEPGEGLHPFPVNKNKQTVRELHNQFEWKAHLLQQAITYLHPELAHHPQWKVSQCMDSQTKEERKNEEQNRKYELRFYNVWLKTNKNSNKEIQGL